MLITETTIDIGKLKAGEYCRKGIPGCFCKVGWPYERQCPDCRDNKNADKFSYCSCPPEKSHID